MPFTTHNLIINIIAMDALVLCTLPPNVMNLYPQLERMSELNDGHFQVEVEVREAGTLRNEL